jgi:hypothetical protein
MPEAAPVTMAYLGDILPHFEFGGYLYQFLADGALDYVQAVETENIETVGLLGKSGFLGLAAQVVTEAERSYLVVLDLETGDRPYAVDVAAEVSVHGSEHVHAGYVYGLLVEVEVQVYILLGTMEAELPGSLSQSGGGKTNGNTENEKKLFHLNFRLQE